MSAAGDDQAVLVANDDAEMTLTTGDPGVVTETPPSLVEDITSTFDGSDEGWRANGGQFAGATRPSAFEAAGATGGYVQAASSGAWYWDAPDKFHGNQAVAYGQRITFYLNRDADGCDAETARRLVILDGAGYSIACDAPYAPTDGWSYFSVPLIETNMWYHQSSNERVTRTELLAVLGSLQRLQIRGWFNGCGVFGAGGLDEVVLKRDGRAAPAPSASLIQNAFVAGPEGWQVANGSFRNEGPVAWQAADGNPDGFLSANGSGNWYWLAPAAYRGDFSASYGMSLRFDLNRSVAGCDADRSDRLVVLQGGGYSITHGADYAPRKTWTNMQVYLLDSEFWYHQGTSDRVTQPELQAVLADLGQVKIRGWMNGCNVNGTGGLDNVVFEVSERGQPVRSGVIESGFGSGVDGWTVAGGAFDAAGPLDFAGQGGASGGYATATGSGAWTWIAPEKFRGDLSAMYGGTLSFDLLRQGDGCTGNQADRAVIIEGGGMAIQINSAIKPRETWTSYAFTLDEKDAWYHVRSNDRVTAAEMKAVLASVGQVKIRGWYNGCNVVGTGGLDSVRLAQP